MVFISSPTPALFQSSQVSGGSSPGSHPHHYPLYYFTYPAPRSPPTVDHSPLPFKPNYPNLLVLGLVSGPFFFVGDTRLSA